MILGVGMVRNEADIVEPFVRHNLKYVDALHIIEHGSVDGTDLVLAALQREGLPVTVREMRTRGYDQEKILSMVVQEATPPTAFVFLDADEFIHGVSPDSFRQQVVAMPEHSVAMVPWRTFVANDHPYGDDYPRDMSKCRREERPQYFKAVLRPRAGAGYMVQLGAHDVHATVPVTRAKVSGLFYAHYPVRSPGQVELKSIVGWLGYALREHSLANQGRQWKNGFLKIMERGGFNWEDLPDVSMRYAQKISDWRVQDMLSASLEYDYQRKYDHLRSPAPVLGLVARTLERVFT